MIFGIISAIFGFLNWAFTSSTLVALAARTAIMVGASYLLNRALAPSIKDPERADGYTFSPQTTEQQGIAVPVHYGANRIHANIVGHYLSIGDGLVTASKVSRYILACFGEGPIETPDDTTVRLNGRPLSDFAEVTAQWRLGTVDQAVPDDWTTFRQDYHVGQECQPNDPITFTLPRTGYDDIEIHFQLPRGIIHYGTDGDSHSMAVTLRVEVGDAITDTWQTLAEHAVGGRTAQSCYFRYVASGTYSGGSAFFVTASMRPRVRVTRLSGVSPNPRYISDLQFAAVQVAKNIGFTHPGMVLLSLAMVPTEATAGGVSELSVESTGRIVADETGAFATSRYHADAIRDILTQPVIEGDGSAETPWTSSYYRAVAPSRLVATGFAAQKALADTLVPDGNGNNVAMLRNDCIFAGGTSVHAAIGAVAASGRCGLTYLGRSFGLWVESPREPVGLLCDGTWERHSAQLVPIEHDQLASEAMVRYRDTDAAFAERTILVTDHQMDTLTTVNLDLAGVTRTHEAARLARRELARNRLVDQTLTCRADVDAAVYEAGDVVYGQIDGRSQGGRITAATATTVILDRTVAPLLTGDDVLLVQIRNADTGVQALEIQAVASISSDGKTITIDGTFDATPSAGDPFLFGPAELLDDDQFEVTETALDEHLHTTLSLVRYAPLLDDLDGVAPGVTVPLGAIQRIHQYGGVLRPALPGATIDAIGTRGAIVFEWGNYTFASGDPGKITWASDTDDEGESSGYVRYGTDLHQPADNTAGTAAAYVYWNPASPNVFLTTNNPADWVNKYLVAINAAGTPIIGVHWAPLDPQAADWGKVSGTGKPQDNATVGATWGVDISDQPVGSLVNWQGTFSSHPPSPVDGWAYYNSTDGKSYIYQDATWYQMTADGVDGLDGVNGADGEDGLSVIWCGEAATPPASPQTNWAYRDTDDGYVYIYNGTAWELMVRDGSDGTDGADGLAGADGSDGLSVFITYHDNAADSPPATPTGDGTAGGWHTNATSSVVWISQKIAVDASSGTWGTPVRISGVAVWDEISGTGKPQDNATDNSAWEHGSDPSKIDGALIYNGTIIAAALNVAMLSAITANMGSMTSGSITLSLGGNTRLRIDSNGIYVSENAGTDWTAVLYNDSGTVTLSADIMQAGVLKANLVAGTTLAGTYVRETGIVGTFIDVTLDDVDFEWEDEEEDWTWVDIHTTFAGDPNLALQGYVKVLDGDTYSWTSPLEFTVRLQLLEDGIVVKNWSRDVSMTSSSEEIKLPIWPGAILQDDVPYQFQYIINGSASDSCDLQLFLEYKFANTYTPAMVGTFFDVTDADVDFEYDPDEEDWTWHDIGAAFPGDISIVYAGFLRAFNGAPFSANWPLEMTVRLRLLRDGSPVERWSREMSLASASEECAVPVRVADLSPNSTYQFQYIVNGGSADACDLQLFLEYGYDDAMQVTK